MRFGLKTWAAACFADEREAGVEGMQLFLKLHEFIDAEARVNSSDWPCLSHERNVLHLRAGRVHGSVTQDFGCVSSGNSRFSMA